MYKAKAVFDIAIQDAERILEAYEHMKNLPDSTRDPEELKRAALIMSLTAWETYVEDRVSEEVAIQIKVLQGSQIGSFISQALEKELKFFHTPNSKKRKIFLNASLVLILLQVGLGLVMKILIVPEQN